MTRIEKWLATHRVAAVLLAGLLGAAVGRGILPGDLAACLDGLLKEPPGDNSSPSTSLPRSLEP